MGSTSKKKPAVPKIRTDAVTGKRYVKVGKKRIWLSKGVTQKDILKFLRRRRKAKTAKKSTRKKVKEVVPMVFGENVSRSLTGHPPAVIITQPKAESIDLDSLAAKVARKLPSMAPLGELDHRLALPSKEKKNLSDKHIPGIGWVTDEVYHNFEDKVFHVKAAQDRARSKAEKTESSLRKDKSALQKEAELEKLKNQLRDAQDEFERQANETFDDWVKDQKSKKLPLNTKSKLLSRLAEKYNMKKGTIAQMILPLAQKITTDPRRKRINPKLTKARERIDNIKKDMENIQKQKLSTPSSRSGSQSSEEEDQHPVHRRRKRFADTSLDDEAKESDDGGQYVDVDDFNQQEFEKERQSGRAFIFTPPEPDTRLATPLRFLSSGMQAAAPPIDLEDFTKLKLAQEARQIANAKAAEHVAELGTTRNLSVALLQSEEDLAKNARLRAMQEESMEEQRQHLLQLSEEQRLAAEKRERNINKWDHMRKSILRGRALKAARAEAVDDEESQQMANAVAGVRESNAAASVAAAEYQRQEDADSLGRLLTQTQQTVNAENAAREAEALAMGRARFQAQQAREAADTERAQRHAQRTSERLRDIGQGGHGRTVEDRGLNTSQINDLMKGYPHYLGCIASDELLTLHFRPGTQFGFVLNTDPSTKSGTHWVAIYVDARPGGSHTIEYYNSLADQPTGRILKDLNLLVKIMGVRLRLKINKVADQSDDSSNCGYFATKFLIDRFNGISFAQASGYNAQSGTGERKIEAWKEDLTEQHGEGVRDVVNAGIGLIKNGVQRVKDVMQGVRHHGSPSLRKWLEKHGEEEIDEMKICRKPIFSAIERLANALSNGLWEKNKADLAYDRMFHLFVVFKLHGDSKVYKIEKNHVVEISTTSWPQNSQTEEIKVGVTTDMTLNKMFATAEKMVGAYKLYVYDAKTQNCQYFVKWMLQYTHAWNAKSEAFTMQNVEGVLEGMGLLHKVARAATDIASVADVALQGAGRVHRRGYGGRR